jgi:potassium-transporting ATPase KdpC subunit
MGTDIKTAIRPAIVILLLFTVITGLIYPLAITGIVQVIFPWQANGSLIRDGDHIVGSQLIGQNFAKPEYFHPRPSAAGDGYNAAGSSGSNLGPTSKTLADNIKERVAAAHADGVAGPVPADMVTASGSGLDPDISPANALDQVARVAKARGLPETAVRELVERSIMGPTAGLLGEAHVNVLLLNRQLDRMGAEMHR